MGESAVIVREDSLGDRRLTGYYVAASNPGPSSADLRTQLSQTLPDYMIPSAFVKMDALPRTPNGKLDKRALPAPDQKNEKLARQTAEPRNPEEQKMSEIWSEVLRVKVVGIDDNLFELGADSLHVFQIVARANKAGFKVTPRNVLQLRTIRAIVEGTVKAPKNGNEAETSNGAASSIVPVSRDKYRIPKTTA